MWVLGGASRCVLSARVLSTSAQSDLPRKRREREGKQVTRSIEFSAPGIQSRWIMENFSEKEDLKS